MEVSHVRKISSGLFLPESGFKPVVGARYSLNCEITYLVIKIETFPEMAIPLKIPLAEREVFIPAVVGSTHSIIPKELNVSECPEFMYTLVADNSPLAAVS